MWVLVDRNCVFGFHPQGVVAVVSSNHIAFWTLRTVASDSCRTKYWTSSSVNCSLASVQAASMLVAEGTVEAELEAEEPSTAFTRGSSTRTSARAVFESRFSATITSTRPNRYATRPLGCPPSPPAVFVTIHSQSPDKSSARSRSWALPPVAEPVPFVWTMYTLARAFLLLFRRMFFSSNWLPSAS